MRSGHKRNGTEAENRKGGRVRPTPQETTMDLQAYFKKIRAMEERLKDPSVVLVSLETQDGGREGLSYHTRTTGAATLAGSANCRSYAEFGPGCHPEEPGMAPRNRGRTRHRCWARQNRGD